MSYLIDSMWVMDALKGTPAARDLFARLTNESLAISLMTYGEVYEGIYYGPSRRVSEYGFRRFLRGVSVLAPNRSIMRRFALIRGDLRNRGELIGDPDIIIAATALHHNLTLVTENVRHFQRIAGLSLYH
jgi:tRNA(fMet)-specific endonuclease VapC